LDLMRMSDTNSDGKITHDEISNNVGIDIAFQHHLHDEM
jgi:hypothetical protein